MGSRLLNLGNGKNDTTSSPSSSHDLHIDHILVNIHGLSWKPFLNCVNEIAFLRDSQEIVSHKRSCEAPKDHICTIRNTKIGFDPPMMHLGVKALKMSHPNQNSKCFDEKLDKFSGIIIIDHEQDLILSWLNWQNVFWDVSNS